MSGKTKTIILIIVILLLLIASFLAGFFIQKGSNSQSVVEYQNTISELGKTIGTLREGIEEIKLTNTEISNGFTELLDDYESLKRDYSSIEIRLREADGIASNLGQGISETRNTVSDLIGSIDEVIKTIEDSGNSE